MANAGRQRKSHARGERGKVFKGAEAAQFSHAELAQ